LNRPFVTFVAGFDFFLGGSDGSSGEGDALRFLELFLGSENLGGLKASYI
jgi:hypothetical protein